MMDKGIVPLMPGMDVTRCPEQGTMTNTQRHYTMYLPERNFVASFNPT